MFHVSFYIEIFGGKTTFTLHVPLKPRPSWFYWFVPFSSGWSRSEHHCTTCFKRSAPSPCSSIRWPDTSTVSTQQSLSPMTTSCPPFQPWWMRIKSCCQTKSFSLFRRCAVPCWRLKWPAEECPLWHFCDALWACMHPGLHVHDDNLFRWGFFTTSVKHFDFVDKKEEAKTCIVCVCVCVCARNG